MKKMATLLVTSLLVVGPLAAEELKVGFVNMQTALTESKMGKQKKAEFEILKKQLSENLEKMDKELSEVTKKLQDQDHMDSLSPTAEEELKQRYQQLSQNVARTQNQSMQILNQANMRMLQELQEALCKSSEVVRTKKSYQFILNAEAAFAYVPSMDVTKEVVLEMDKGGDLPKESK